MVTESPAFKKAVEDSRKLKSKPTDDDLLHIYGLYKTGTGADLATAEKPGMFDLKGKAKMKAWVKVVEEDKLTPGQAQQEYVKKVEGLKGSSYQSHPSRRPTAPRHRNTTPTESPAFQKAVEDSRKLESKPNNDELLELYALYKTGTGADFATAEKPGIFDLKGKAKMNAWNKLLDEDVSPERAQEMYVALVQKLKASLGFSG